MCFKVTGATGRPVSPQSGQRDCAEPLVGWKAPDGSREEQQSDIRVTSSRSAPAAHRFRLLVRL
jgi:hypothetical protein